MNFLFTITDEFSDEIAGIYSTLMPKERRLRFVQCQEILHKKQIVAAYMLLCYSLHKIYGDSFVRLEFDYGPTGKPYLHSDNNKFFSISHSDEYVLCSISSFPIGVDIQKNFSCQHNLVEFSVSESLIKLKDDYNNTGLTNDICTKNIDNINYILSISGFGSVDAFVIEVQFQELIEYFNQRTTIGEYLKLNNHAHQFEVKYTPLELFKQNVRTNGDRKAVSFKGQSLTYKELDSYSDVIAQRLLNAGAKIGDAILLSIGPSIEFSIAQFAIMKVGCTYVPVYTRWPIERINYILNDCNIEIGIFNQDELFFRCDVKTKIICNDYFGHNKIRINVDEKLNEICYIIYTSGSTGSPKGVMVTKTNLASFSFNKEGTYYRELVKSNYVRVACICPTSFDMSVAENTTSLLNGGTVYFADEEEQYPENFADFILNNKIDVVWATPSKFKMYLLSDTCSKVLNSLKLVVLAGEVLDFETARLASAFSFELYNTYGPTETTIISTYYHVKKIEPNLPIGRPFANEYCYVLDSDNNLCEVGTKGELFIAGQSVAAGYKNNSDQTKERFLKNIFGSGMMYRTGDVVSLETDGLLHFYGRKDNQVKVRGFRVELEEIESAIYEYTRKKTVVYYCNGQLIAFIESIIGIPNLSAKLKNILPDYMIPALIYYTEKFPLNNNGKTDKQVLLSLIRDTNLSIYIAPKSKIEKLIANCWSRYLNGARVGVDDDFYQLGGDSIIAMRIASELRKKDIDVSMFDIMNSKTVRNLIKNINEHQKENIDLVHAKMDPSLGAPNDKIIPLDDYFQYQKNFSHVFDQQEYIPLKMHKSIMESEPSCNRIIYRVNGTKDKEAVLNAIKKLVRNNAAFRTIYNRKTGNCIQVSFYDNWIIPLLETKNINKNFLDANYNLNIQEDKQFLSYIFLAEDIYGYLYIVIILHWRFLDRAAELNIKTQLVSYLNNKNFYPVGIIDPLTYARFIKEACFKKDVIPNDIETSLSEFAALSSDIELSCLLNNLNCYNINCYISMDKSMFETYNNNPLNFVINVFAQILLDMFHKTKFPIYIVDQNRNITNNNLIDTVIDFLPIVITDNKHDYYKQIKKILALRQDGESLIESGDWNKNEGLLPFINYVSVLDERDETDIDLFEKSNIEIEIDKKRSDKISCSAFIKKGKLVLSFSLPDFDRALLHKAILNLIENNFS